MYLKPKIRSWRSEIMFNDHYAPRGYAPKRDRIREPAVTRRDMLLAGAPLDLIGLIVTVLGSCMLGSLLLG